MTVFIYNPLTSRGSGKTLSPYFKGSVWIVGKISGPFLPIKSEFHSNEIHRLLMSLEKKERVNNLKWWEVLNGWKISRLQPFPSRPTTCSYGLPLPQVGFPSFVFCISLWSTSSSSLNYFFCISFDGLPLSLFLSSFWGAVSLPSNVMGSVSQSVTVSDFKIYLMEKNLRWAYQILFFSLKILDILNSWSSFLCFPIVYCIVFTPNWLQ